MVIPTFIWKLVKTFFVKCSTSSATTHACLLVRNQSILPHTPHMNGFQLCEKILAIDINVKICFMSSGEINRKALREIYPSLSLGCFEKTNDYRLST